MCLAISGANSRRAKGREIRQIVVHSQSLRNVSLWDKMNAESAPVDYKFAPLPEGQFIRYLVLEPGRGDDPLVGSLHASHLDETPPFEAISYVWGTPVRDQVITCMVAGAAGDGTASPTAAPSAQLPSRRTILRVTPNLRDALRRVRNISTPRVLWADSICINQNDPREQGHQVAFMGRIYAAAIRVLVVLGPDPAGQAAAASSLVKDVHAMVRRTLATPPVAPDLAWDSFPHPALDEPLLTDPRWSALGKLVSQPWFARGWVVQEAGLARESVVLWGDYPATAIDWVQLSWTLLWGGARGDSLPGEGHSQRLHQAVFVKQHEDEARTFLLDYAWQKFSMARILESTRPLRLTDERDRIYAAVALAESFGTLPFVVVADYMRPFVEVYHDFAARYLRVTRDLSMLDYLQHDDETLANDVPSWVPRWDCQVHWASVIEGNVFVKSLTDAEPEVEVLADGRMLRVRGIVYDALAFCSNQLDTMADPLGHVAYLAALIISNTSIPPSPAARLLAFVEALSGTMYTGTFASWQPHRAAYMTHLCAVGGIALPGSDAFRIQLESLGGDWCVFHDFVYNYGRGRRFAITDSGSYALVPVVARVGDACALVFGTQVSMVLRPAGRSSHYRILGQAAVLATECPSLNRGENGGSLLGLNRHWVRKDDKESDIFLV
jgi:hypothetical protein